MKSKEEEGGHYADCEKLDTDLSAPCICEELRAAERRGAEKMRERAAMEFEREGDLQSRHADESIRVMRIEVGHGQRKLAAEYQMVATQIRSVPLDDRDPYSL